MPLEHRRQGQRNNGVGGLYGVYPPAFLYHLFSSTYPPSSGKTGLEEGSLNRYIFSVSLFCTGL